MPTPVTRFALAAAVVLTVAALGSAGTAVAVADTDEPGGVGSDVSTGLGSGRDEALAEIPGVADEPSSTANAVDPVSSSSPAQPSEPPVTIFGNGRVPGDPVADLPGVTEPVRALPARRASDVIAAAAPRPVARVPSAPETVAMTTRSVGTVGVRKPVTARVAPPVPAIPGAGNASWTTDPTDPLTAYTTITQTFATFSSLIADACAPYGPTPELEPEPEPEPALRILREGPVLDVDGTGGGDAVSPVSVGGGGHLPVLQAPPLVAPRLVPPSAPSRTIRGVSPAPDGPATGSAPALRGSVTPTGTAPAAEPIPAGAAAASPVGIATVRQGYAQSLRVARTGDIAIIAGAGVAGLLALTFSGGVIGYRQANSGRYLRVGAARFMH